MQYRVVRLFLDSELWRCVRIFLATAMLLKISLLFEFILPSKIPFNKIETSSTVSWVSHTPVPEGKYFISVGRAQGGCSLFYGGSKLDANMGLVGLSERSALFLGSSLHVNSERQHISLSCQKELGSPIRLIHSIYVHDYRTGSFIHLVRQLTDLVLPLAITAYFLSFIVVSSRMRLGRLLNAGLLTGVMTFTYLVSLVNLPRLFLSNLDALFLHSLLRFGFVLSMLYWLSGGRLKKRVFSAAFVGLALILQGCYLVNEGLLFKVYLVFCHLIPTGVLGVIFFLRSKFPQNQAWFRFAPILATSSLDLLFHHTGGGAFVAPISTISVFGLATGDYIRKQRALGKARKALAKVSSLLLDSPGSIGKLSQVSEELANAFGLEKWSIYLDSCFLGKCAGASQEMTRIASSLKHIHPDDPVIRLIDPAGFGGAMINAIGDGTPLCERAESDGCLYVIIPISGVGCLNFSAVRKYAGDYEQIKVILDEVFQDITLAIARLVRGELASNLSVSAIREELGPGAHDLSYGVIFADAVGYTQNVQRSEKFVEFFQFEYVPALLRHLGRNVSLKDLFGDEMFLVVRNFTEQNESNVLQDTALAIQALQEFISGHGANMCEVKGFDKLTFKVGAHAGKGQIIVTGTDLSLSGPIIEAKRCQGRARGDEPFVSKALFEFLSEAQREDAVTEVYAAKKEILSGYRLRKRAA